MTSIRLLVPVERTARVVDDLHCDFRCPHRKTEQVFHSMLCDLAQRTQGGLMDVLEADATGLLRTKLCLDSEANGKEERK